MLCKELMNEVHVYIFDDMDSLSDNYVEHNLHRLPRFRQAQCAQYRQDSDKKACIISYLLLERGLQEKYSITTPISFIYNENGKPYIREAPHIFFNLSHCKSGVVCAFADFEIGVDIQEIRSFDIDVARRVCSDDELHSLEKADNPASLFCRIWTEKESYAKMKGISVAATLKQTLPAKSFRHIERKQYCMTICLGKAVEFIDFNTRPEYPA